MTRTVVMVDLYAPTMRLAQAYLDRGFDVVQLQSTPEVPPVYRGFDGVGLSGRIVHGGGAYDSDDLERTIELVAALNPVAVTTGGETGVELADLISERLGLATNGSALSSVRRDKFAMIERLRSHGLRATAQLLVPDVETLRCWHESVGGRVVIKPTRSAGNDGVQFCADSSESVAAYRQIVHRQNIFGVTNEGVVAQQFLVGGEYVVNTVSSRGAHRVTDMWKYVKMSANGVSDRVGAAVSVPGDDSRRAALVDYATSVLDALGIEHGPAHLEIMMTPDGPCLVEIGARLCGADTARYAEIARGESQIDWTVTAFTDPDEFAREHTRPAVDRSHAAMVFSTSPYEGTLRSYPKLDQVLALPSYVDHQLVVPPGGQLQRTVSDVTEPMMIGLSHPVRDVLERDLTTVLFLDGDGFYDVAAEPDATAVGAP
ncbi:ATP-grasp domain-containing protein [Rhodococcus sp. NPDC058521]|uniref:ATP-grasp domain-containing protein n=1 Tax=Rhodococcus sp. NPDC058521 TaxID=3346536 RepID=UPI0036597992